MAEARSVFGENAKFFLYQVSSSGPIADSVFVGLSATGPSKMAQDLAEILARGENSEIKIAVAGDHGPKTRQVLLDALQLNRGKKLKGLALLFIGPSQYREEVQKAVEDVGAAFYFRSEA